MEETHLCVPLLVPTMYRSGAEISLKALQYSYRRFAGVMVMGLRVLSGNLYARCDDVDDVDDVGGVIGCVTLNQLCSVQNNHETLPLLLPSIL
jgi:hypothetical protein